MPRLLPVITLGRPMKTRARFRPEGVHICEVELGQSELRLNTGEVDRLLAALNAFKAAEHGDGQGPGVHSHERVESLGEF